MNRQDAKDAKIYRIVIPAKAGIHSSVGAGVVMDSRFRAGLSGEKIRESYQPLDVPGFNKAEVNARLRTTMLSHLNHLNPFPGQPCAFAGMTKKNLRSWRSWRLGGLSRDWISAFAGMMGWTAPERHRCAMLAVSGPSRGDRP